MSEGTCDVNMFDNEGIIFKPPKELEAKLRKHYEEAMRFKFDDVFETKEDGQFSCKIDPRALREEKKYEFTLHKCLDQISNEHRKILDEWCKAFLAKEYEIGNDIHPGCFTIEQRQVNEPNGFGWDYMLVPNDQNLGVRVKWKNIKEESPKDFKDYLVSDGKNIWVAEWSNKGFVYHPSYPYVDPSFWMEVHVPEKKIQEWKELGMCCYNFWDCVR